ncbi:MAG: UDP-N-acetylmuramate:L-alanyl-gamma-D-glutamyl-meso-diaminopimelate ligase [Acidobacteriota bacterium]|nr:UDP-N-acetylmuramate:L-alanyl-gamma-D-glutamyl-meso-diaminopimelate ligase [Blastocatellia bacterium]MDW8238069.1 UDP-N-acetylmuramate:L-alanyl-gamma-D-glutamyl-meso-diaminopimelate ligase [Acidobacteriota bacterium]
MAGLAGLLKAQGHHVTGSDENVYPPMSTLLEQLGVTVLQGYRPEHLQPPPDVVVIGNALSRGNPEIEETLNAKLYYTSMPQVIKEQFIRGRHSIVVAGTHGKTTTTSLVTWLLEAGGLSPSFLIGGVAENFGSSFRLTDSPYFVIEGDEYDTAYFDKGPKFMHYLPDTAILNCIEFDHADIYDNLEAVKLAFRRFVNLIPGNGALIADFDSPHVRDVSTIARCSLHTFGLGDQAEWRATDISASAEGMRFRVVRNGQEWGEVSTPLIGEMNARNVLAAIAAATLLGVERRIIAQALPQFKSVKRRLEVLGEVDGVTVIDDFAHHPTAVRSTLEALRDKYPGRRLIAVFEPRSRTSRLKIFQQEFEEALSGADMAVIAPLYNPGVAPQDDWLSVDMLVEQLNRRGTRAHAPGSVDEIVAYLTEETRRGDVVAIMSNGAFGGIHQKLMAALANRSRRRRIVSDT